MANNINNDLAYKVINKINLKKLIWYSWVRICWFAISNAFFNEKGFKVCGYDKDERRLKIFKSKFLIFLR